MGHGGGAFSTPVALSRMSDGHSAYKVEAS